MWIGHFRGLAKAVNRQTPDWGQEELNIASGYEFWERATGVLEQRPP